MKATKHAKARFRERGLTVRQINDAIKSPRTVIRNGTKETRKGLSCTVVLDTAKDVIVTVF